jgi:hypothetical protein
MNFKNSINKKAFLFRFCKALRKIAIYKIQRIESAEVRTQSG